MYRSNHLVELRHQEPYRRIGSVLSWKPEITGRQLERAFHQWSQVRDTQYSTEQHFHSVGNHSDKQEIQHILLQGSSRKALQRWCFPNPWSDHLRYAFSPIPFKVCLEVYGRFDRPGHELSSSSLNGPGKSGFQTSNEWHPICQLTSFPFWISWFSGMVESRTLAMKHFISWLGIWVSIKPRMFLI